MLTTLTVRKMPQVLTTRQHSQLCSSPFRGCRRPAESVQQLCVALQRVWVPVCSTPSGHLCAGTGAETISAASLTSWKVWAKPWGPVVLLEATALLRCLAPGVSHRAWLPRKQHVPSERRCAELSWLPAIPGHSWVKGLLLWDRVSLPQL